MRGLCLSKVKRSVASVSENKKKTLMCGLKGENGKRERENMLCPFLRLFLRFIVGLIFKFCDNFFYSNFYFLKFPRGVVRWC